MTEVGPPLSREQLGRYLAALGVPRRAPSREALDELVTAHLTRVPFENVSKLCYRRRLGLTGLPPLDLFLEGLERHRLGGTCYSNNCHLWSLLVSLGYEARLCGADMSKPDVHAVIVVRLEGRELLVDGGYGAPFFVPLPLDVGLVEAIAWGQERYLLHPRDAAGRSRLVVTRDGVEKHGYVVKPTPRLPEDFRRVIADSFRPEATFMNAIAIYRFERQRSLALRNLRLIESTPEGFTSRSLKDRDELVAVVEARFGIPAELVKEAVGGLRDLKDVWA